MSGRITTLHLITHAHLIISEFGWKAYCHAWWSAIRGGTFLEAIDMRGHDD
jgi:hypothetical protein